MTKILFNNHILGATVFESRARNACLCIFAPHINYFFTSEVSGKTAQFDQDKAELVVGNSHI